MILILSGDRQGGIAPLMCVSHCISFGMTFELIKTCFPHNSANAPLRCCQMQTREAVDALPTEERYILLRRVGVMVEDYESPKQVVPAEKWKKLRNAGELTISRLRCSCQHPGTGSNGRATSWKSIRRFQPMCNRYCHIQCVLCIAIRTHHRRQRPGFFVLYGACISLIETRVSLAMTHNARRNDQPTWPELLVCGCGLALHMRILM